MQSNQALTFCRLSVTMSPCRLFMLKVMDLQLSLFPDDQKKQSVKKQKKAKLGRYERIQRELATVKRDPYQVLVDINIPSKPLYSYNFIDLFCGAGGITQGLVQAGLYPVASAEISPIASATHKKTFQIVTISAVIYISLRLKSGSLKLVFH